MLDSQTVRSDAHGGAVGYDAGKQTKGRKRFVRVDPLGLLLGAFIAPADRPERAGAQALLAPRLPGRRRRRRIWGDGGYDGPEFARWVQAQAAKVRVEVVRKCVGQRGFSVLPRRWVVERTWGWLMQHRRLVRDYEKTESSAAGWLVVALIRVMLRRLG